MRTEDAIRFRTFDLVQIDAPPRAYGERLRKNPKDPTALRALIYFTLNAGRPLEAENLLSPLLFDNPGDRSALAALAIACQMRRQVDRALAVMQLWAVSIMADGAIGERDFRAAQAFAVNLVSLGQKDAAYRFVDRLTEFDGSVELGRHIRAELYVQEKEDEKAFKEFLELNRLNPKNVAYYAGLYDCARRVKNLSVAHRVLKAYAERFPRYIQPARNQSVSNILVLDSFYTPVHLPDNFGIGIRPYVRYNAVAQLTQLLRSRFTFQALLVNDRKAVDVARDIEGADVVLNNIANADGLFRNELAEIAGDVVRVIGKPVLNSPDRILPTSRVGNYQRFKEDPDFIFPRTVPFHVDKDDPANKAEEVLKAFEPPFIIRLATSHHGGKVYLIEKTQDVVAVLGELKGAQIYAIDYHDCAYRPGLWRKFRVAYIDGTLYPVEVDFRDHWMVHRIASADHFMQAQSELKGAEARFLDNMYDEIDAAHVETLTRIGNTIGLDFIGIDFGFDQNGRMVVYEANASMNLLAYHFMKDHPYVRASADAILTAFMRLILDRSRGARALHSAKPAESALQR